MPKILIEVGGSSHEFCEDCPNFGDRWCNIFFVGLDDDLKGNFYRCEDCKECEFHEVIDD